MFLLVINLIVLIFGLYLLVKYDLGLCKLYFLFFLKFELVLVGILWFKIMFFFSFLSLLICVLIEVLIKIFGVFWYEVVVRNEFESNGICFVFLIFILLKGGFLFLEIKWVFFFWYIWILINDLLKKFELFEFVIRILESIWWIIILIYLLLIVIFCKWYSFCIFLRM